MENQPFFTRDGGRYLPTTASRGPWNENSLHGRVVIGLLAHAIEAEHGEDGFTPARLTVDMYRLPGFDPAKVTTRLVRAGGRIKVVDAEFVSGGVSMGRATAQLLRRTQAPEGTVWGPPAWDAPAPADIAPADPRMGMGGMWVTRTISGGAVFGEGATPGPRRLWMSEVRRLVEGEALTPFTRVALASDFASPFAHAGDKGLAYINTDVTLYLHRLPATEWIGFEVVDHQASDGIAVGACRLHDEQGPIGTANVAALAQRRMA